MGKPVNYISLYPNKIRVGIKFPDAPLLNDYVDIPPTFLRFTLDGPRYLHGMYTRDNGWTLQVSWRIDMNPQFTICISKVNDKKIVEYVVEFNELKYVENVVQKFETYEIDESLTSAKIVSHGTVNTNYGKNHKFVVAVFNV